MTPRDQAAVLGQNSKNWGFAGYVSRIVDHCVSLSHYLATGENVFFPIEESLIQPVMFDRIHFTKYFIAIVTRFVPLALPHLTN